jgi:hypothetical protein
LIEELSQPDWIVQKQPANHCLKPCGPSIHCSVGSSRTTPRTVTTPSDQIKLVIVKQILLFKPRQKVRLSISANLGDDSLVQRIGASWTSSKTKALVKLPNSITNPSQLKRP